MKEIGLMIKPMASEFTFISMELSMNEIGETICNMEMEKKLGLMVRFMKENTSWERNMDMAYIAGTMGLDMKVNGLKTRLKVLEHTPGLMEGNIKESG